MPRSLSHQNHAGSSMCRVGGRGRPLADPTAVWPNLLCSGKAKVFGHQIASKPTCITTSGGNAFHNTRARIICVATPTPTTACIQDISQHLRIEAKNGHQERALHTQ